MRSEGSSCTSVIKQRTRGTTEEENVNEQMDNYMQHKNEEIAIMMRMMTEIKNLISEQTKQNINELSQHILLNFQIFATEEPAYWSTHVNRRPNLLDFFVRKGINWESFAIQTCLDFELDHTAVAGIVSH
uniref:Uncharacterized protein n=1 Tax=Vespula pensylvanica TaxID=30213 RepID=A0A834JZ98_VESPE|nr:hypothetical protein H0235_016729 [Vespula pensylvanica]